MQADACTGCIADDGNQLLTRLEQSALRKIHLEANPRGSVL
jgi:hypothetical protein